jgi:phosphate transport system protein
VGDDQRSGFQPDLNAIDDRIQRLFGLVRSALADATDALLTGDQLGAQRVMAADRAVDELAEQTDLMVQHEMELATPAGSEAPPDVRYLVTALRIVPQLERSADLVEHIAALAASGLVSATLSVEVNDLLADMAATASSMWAESARAWAARDPTASERLEDQDDELDVVADALTGKLGSEDVAVPMGMKLALLVRFYERLGDHAVHLARRIRYLVNGD